MIDHLLNVIDATTLVMDLPIKETILGKDKDKAVEANSETFKQIWPVTVYYVGDKSVIIAIENRLMTFSNDEWLGRFFPVIGLSWVLKIIKPGV